MEISYLVLLLFCMGFIFGWMAKDTFDYFTKDKEMKEHSKALSILKELKKGYSIHKNDLDDAIAELEALQESKQKSYTLGYVQGYLARENQEVPEDIRELLKEQQ